MIPVGKALKLIREQKNISQGYMYYLCGLERTYICRVEKGRTEPKMQQLEKFAKAFDTEVWKIVRYAERLEKYANTARVVMQSTSIQ